MGKRWASAQTAVLTVISWIRAGAAGQADHPWNKRPLFARANGRVMRSLGRVPQERGEGMCIRENGASVHLVGLALGSRLGGTGGEQGGIEERPEAEKGCQGQ